ncbi:MAG TPA: hypothetical protein VLX61_08285 [Anaerolineales bacterium]|nr:hypothetical protein [Anaerolineales bacterium]
MMRNISEESNAKWMWGAGIIADCLGAGFEVQAAFRVPQDWPKLLSLVGAVTIFVYVVLLLFGLTALLLSLFAPISADRFSGRIERLGWIRWPIVGALIFLVGWFYLYSPWQDILTGPWLQFVFSLGLTAWIVSLISPHRVVFRSWDEIMFALWLFLFPRVVVELRSTEASVYRPAVLIGYFLVLVLAFCLFSSFHPKILNALIKLRNRMGWLRWPAAAIIMCGPLLFYYLAGTRPYVTNPNIRFSFLLVELVFISMLIWRNDQQLVCLKTILIGAFALALSSALTSQLLTVTNYPFSIGWSEGDQFYVYSLVFAQRLYNSSRTIVFGSPGRYGLWGLPFLFPTLPIVVDRFWRVVLLTIPPLLVGWALTRKIDNRFLRLGLALWIALFFIVEAPLHPEFMLAAFLVFAFMFDPSLVVRGISLAAASLYLGLSRYTWVPVTACWGVLVDLILYYRYRSGSFVHRILPTLVLGLTGIIPGISVNYGFFVARFAGSLAVHQPLLWYRLFPNATMPLGVLLGVLLYSGPLLIVLIWWITSGRWRLDWLQSLTVSIGLAGFFIAGLIVSMKIGGGADLHNMDMYLMTLILISVLGFYTIQPAGKISPVGWPFGIQILIALAVLTPLYGFTSFPHDSAYDPILDLPKPQDSQKALGDIQNEVLQTSRQGSVLFMDQRQLLTFNYVSRIPFVPDYEKLDMMNQAMAGNAAYFHTYYQDLANKRFSLIVTEVLRVRRTTGAFSEENNDWVDWVSRPTLCFYQPLATFADINVQLLIPSPDISACQKYLK